MIKKYKHFKKSVYGNEDTIPECSFHVLIPDVSHPEFPNMLGYLVFQYRTYDLDESYTRMVVINDNPKNPFGADDYASDRAFEYVIAYTLGVNKIPYLDLFRGPFIDNAISELKTKGGNAYTSREFYRDIIKFVFDCVERDFDVEKEVDDIMKDDNLINFKMMLSSTSRRWLY